MPTIHIHKLVHGGQGLGYHNSKPYFVWNALPGEQVEVLPIRSKSDYVEGLATQIIQPSASRLAPSEDHYLSCSPWSILDYSAENDWKKQIAEETYAYHGLLTPDTLQLQYFANSIQTAYRNKMEYSFVWDDQGQWHLGFSQRGSHRKTPINPCCLAHPLINRLAADILRHIRHLSPPIKTLKSLILRTNGQQVLAGIFVKDHQAFDYATLQHIAADGLKVYYSRPQSPASTTDELLYTQGADQLTHSLLNHPLTLGLNSFYQINEPLAAQAFSDIGQFLDGDHLVDYFAGVGAISLALQDQISSAILVESNPEAVDFANINIQASRLTQRYQAVCLPAEKASAYLTSDKTVIFDPPRAGLHQDTINAVLQHLPPKIIYLSCNIITQARDIARLQPSYHPIFLKAYNFFPRTPHIEGLTVLLRKSDSSRHFT